MSSRRSVRQLLVAVLLGVLVGGGLMAVTPAGAEVSNAVATNWKKIWKKNLKPLADKRYYTKAQGDAKYSTKAETAAGDAASNAATDSKLGGYYKKTESDAKYAAAGSSYSKAESDAKYDTTPAVIRGAYFTAIEAPGSNDSLSMNISFGVTLKAAPTVHVIAPAAAAPAGCSGSVTSPGASPGHLCIFVRANTNVGQLTTCTVNNVCGTAPNGQSSPFGAFGVFLSTAAGHAESSGSWALGTGGLAGVSASAPATSGHGASGLTGR